MKRLAELFDRYGTDKDAGHQYAPTYEALLGPQRLSIKRVLEVGIGTLDPNAPSSMVGYAAPHYRPGGSLRAWRDWMPNAHIWGLDIAPDTQFDNEPRITTLLADSTDLSQVDAALGDLRFDLIIDDANHIPKAQRATLANLWPRLSPGGFYVIEDCLMLCPGSDMVVIRAAPHA